MYKCKRNNCGRYYHLACLEKDNRVQWTDGNVGGKSFLCPQHTCRTCNEQAPPVRQWKVMDPSKIFLQCIYCPNANHKLCVDEESSNKILTNKSMVCDAHMVDGEVTVSVHEYICLYICLCNASLSMFTLFSYAPIISLPTPNYA